MSKRGKDKAKAMSLAEFTGKKKEEELAWAEDGEWDNAPEGEVGEDGAHRQKLIARKAGQMTSNFRDEPVERPSNYVDLNQPPPFVAHVGNVPHKMTVEELKDELTSVFNLNVVKATVTTREKATFAYVEFETVQDLQNAVIQSGKFIGGRASRISVATQQQKDRMREDRGPKNAPTFSRDDIGTTRQPEYRNEGMMGGNRSSFGNASGSLGDLDHWRDAPAQAQPEVHEDAGDFRSGPRFHAQQQQQPPAAPADFSGWRETDRVEQPHFQAPPTNDEEQPPLPGTHTEPGKKYVSSPKGSWRSGGRGSRAFNTEEPPKKEKPASGCVFDDWRTGVPEKQPEAKAEQEDGNNAESDEKPHKETKPAESAKSQDAPDEAVAQEEEEEEEPQEEDAQAKPRKPQPKKAQPSEGKNNAQPAKKSQQQPKEKEKDKEKNKKQKQQAQVKAILRKPEPKHGIALANKFEMLGRK